MTKINRYPKMVALQYWRAIKLNFDVNFAKAVAIAEATKYAIFKNVQLKRAVEKTQNKKRGFSVYSKAKECVEFNIKKVKEFNLYVSVNGYPIAGGKEVKPEDFDKYMDRFDAETKERLLNWAKNIIENTDYETLKVESRFFNKVWKQVRDREVQ